jgi:methylisocitrate lyase
MGWLLNGTAGNSARRLRALLSEGATVAVPGVYDGLSARLAADAGFRALYLSGAALSASMALPDLGVLISGELVQATKRIVRAADLPVIVDGDTGYGETLNAIRLTRELAEAGAAGIQIEDQVMPKRCGHLEGKQLVTLPEMLARIRAVCSASGEMVVGARTDARGVAGMDETIARARAFFAAGADVVFPEGLESAEEFARVRAAVDGPLLANMTEFGKTEMIPVSRFAELGYQLVIFPVSSLRLAAGAIRDGFAILRESGSMERALPRMFTRREFYDLIEYDALEARSREAGPASAGGSALA